MRRFRSIRGRRGRKRVATGGLDLQLTSMLDVLVIIVVFLLKSYATSTNNFTTVPGMQIPYSASQDIPPDSLQILITPEAITFEDVRVVEFVQTSGSLSSQDASYAFKQSDLDEGGRRIVALFDALNQAKQKSEVLRAKSAARDEKGNPLPFEGIVAITADKRVQYDTIRKIMYTAAAAGYRTFRFLALAREI